MDEFERPFHPDPLVLNTYKKVSLFHVTYCFVSNGVFHVTYCFVSNGVLLDIYSSHLYRTWYLQWYDQFLQVGQLDWTLILLGLALCLLSTSAS